MSKTEDMGWAARQRLRYCAPEPGTCWNTGTCLHTNTVDVTTWQSATIIHVCTKCGETIDTRIPVGTEVFP